MLQVVLCFLFFLGGGGGGGGTSREFTGNKG